MRSRTARRLVEWSILAIVVLLLAGIFGQQVRTVQAQAELAAVRSTLGALRTALVIDHMIATIRTGGPSVASPQRNPFLLMDPVPANYAGALGTLTIDAVARGSWVFDPLTSSIGYAPKYGQTLEPPSETATLWFRMSAVAGMPQLTAQRSYTWMGEVLQ